MGQDDRFNDRFNRLKGLRPVFKEPGKELSEKVNESVKAEVEKIRLELEGKAEERIKAILSEREALTKREKADKIAEAINAAKSIKDDKERMHSVITETGEVEIHPVVTAEKGNVHDLGIDCPTCKGHVHKDVEDKSGLVYRCTKDGCGFEAVVVRKDADFKCNNCSMPIKKPEKPEDMDGCPFCKSKKAFRHDWSKVWGVVKK